MGVFFRRPHKPFNPRHLRVVDQKPAILYRIGDMRISKSFTIEPDISSYVDETKGERSASERVNELLRLAMLQEQYERLEAEAAEFFSDAPKDRAGTKAFQKASLRTFGRD
jgi:hypothetical protein